NEWAWLAACAESVFHAPGYPASWDEGAAHRTLQALAAGEQSPPLLALVHAAAARGLPSLADDEALTLGLGAGGRTWPLAQLPAVDGVPWDALHSIPSALVTGSNGKTTTTRLLAAMLRAQGLRTGHCCTDGVYVDGEQIASGDWSGPGGARAVLRDARVQAAVLETARGGLLRRGLALAQVDAAVVTNVSADHYGEYGIHDLEGLAEAKLTVARGLRTGGVLVLNADDPVLSARGEHAAERLAWFARDDAHPRLQELRARGGSTCGVADGWLVLSSGDQREALADIAQLPLAAGGLADYNVGNAAAACLLAHALGVPPAVMADVLARFGTDPADNPGRLQRWNVGGVHVLLDYAHNPDGLRLLLRVARAAGPGRLGVVLGQAGNRSNDDIRALAAVAAQIKPDRVVLKDIDGFIRGRAEGEVAVLLREELLLLGMDASQLHTCLPEAEAAAHLLAWAQPGDVLVLLIHGLAAKAQVVAQIELLQRAS
nr:Mur ligase [Arenimonas sp.]